MIFNYKQNMLMSLAYFKKKFQKKKPTNDK